MNSSSPHTFFYLVEFSLHSCVSDLITKNSNFFSFHFLATLTKLLPASCKLNPSDLFNKTHRQTKGPVIWFAPLLEGRYCHKNRENRWIKKNAIKIDITKESYLLPDKIQTPYFIPWEATFYHIFSLSFDGFPMF